MNMSPAEREKFFDTKVGQIVLSFLLTTVVGTILGGGLQVSTWWMQAKRAERQNEAAWNRQKNYEILRRRLDQAERTLDGIADVTNKRFLRLQKVYWAMDRGDWQAANVAWGGYQESVDEWNEKLVMNKNKLAHFAGDSTAAAFLNYGDERPEYRNNPTSVHGWFVLTHNRVLAWKRSSHEDVEQEVTLRRAAGAALGELNIRVDAFLDGASDVYRHTAAELEK